MDFLQITAQVRGVNASAGTFIFTEMEIRDGIKKLLPYVPVVFKTAQGFAKTYPLNQQTKLDFDVYFETPKTIDKLADLQLWLSQGCVFDIRILRGLQEYSAQYDALVRDPIESDMTYFELTEFDRDYRTINAAGLTWRDKCAIQFWAGVRPAVYSQADFIASAPLLGGFGN